MSRIISEDFDNLLDFFRKYNLKSLVDDENFKPIISRMHKKYFSLLALLVELDNLGAFKSELNKNDHSKDYLYESMSDLGNSFFLTLNGAYKSSRLMLRSSIETFVKGIAVEQLPNIITEKRVSRIFEEAADISLFENDPLKSCFFEIKTKYSELCADTHTAHTTNMQHMSALNYFPTKDINNAGKVADLFVFLIQNYIFIISMKYNEFFHKIHHSNKSDIKRAIKKSYRPFVLNLN